MTERRLLQWLLLPLVLIVILGGWFFPFLGWIVPIVMILGIVTSIFHGRLFCGYFCPRGAFYDRLISYISAKRHIPSWLRSMTFRWIVVVLLIGLMISQLIKHFDHVGDWGHIFWFMCTGTTLIGVLLAFFYHPRTWCAFCPIGTIGRVAGGSRSVIHLDISRCVDCRKCEKVCPMDLNIIRQTKQETIVNPDCLQCRECIQSCPRRALSP